MATRITSSRSLVGVQSIAFIRPIDITLTLSASRPNTKMFVYFDGVNVNEYCKYVNGTLGENLTSDALGRLTLIFSIPGGTFSTGTKTITITDSDDFDNLNVSGSVFGSATANFTTSGVTEFYQTTTTITQIVESVQIVEVPATTNVDPLAQSFFTYGVKGGCFVTSIELYFNTRDSVIPVQVDIREMVNGLPAPGTTRDPEKTCVVDAYYVNTSKDGSIPTKFIFKKPVYLKEDSDYCFVVFSNSKNYNIFTSKLGEVSFETGRTIFEQPYSGSLFKSENNITWQPEQFEDIKFKMNIAKFDVNSNSVVRLKSVANYLGIDGKYLTTTNGSNIVRVSQTVQHGLEANSKIYIIGDFDAIYNGISYEDISGQRNVTNVIDAYTFEFAAGANATSTGQILNGGQVRSVFIENSGTNYTEVPTITFTGGGGTGAAATARILNGKIIGIDITNPGSDYTSQPTVTITGNGVDAAAIAIIDAKFSLSVNKPTAFVQSNIPHKKYSDTSISAKLIPTQLNYDGGNLNTYSPGTSVDFSLTGRTYMQNHSVIASINNEADRMNGNPSMLVEYSLSTANPNVSPMIDISNAPSLISYNYKLNNQAGEDLSATTSTGVLSQIVLLNAGSGYTVPPAITFIGGGGEGGSATAVLGASSLSQVNVTSGGSGYTSVPTVSITGGDGTGAVATAVLAGTGIASIAVTSGGSGYSSTPSIVFSGGGGGSGATATAVLSSTSIASVSVTSGGSGYTSAPTIAFSGGGGSGAAATATVVGGVVTAITINTAGTGYTSIPTITITGGGGSGAEAVAVLATRSVASITLNTAGSGYTVQPSIIFTGGGGSGAAATATLSPREVSAISLVNGGSGYTSAPTVSITGGGGSGATATAVVSGRSLSTIVITETGSNYSSPPEVVISRTDGSTGVDAIASSVLTTFNSELSSSSGTAKSKYFTKKFNLATPSTGINLFSEIYSESQSSVDWYIRTSKSGTDISHDSLDWVALNCDQTRNLSSKRGEVFDYKFYIYGLPEFDTYDLKCVLRSTDPIKAPEVNNYRVIIVA